MQIQAPSLQEAFTKAAEALGCSVTQLDIKILQHPRAGFFGFFKKDAIIEANLESGFRSEKNQKRHELNKDESKKRQKKKDHKQEDFKSIKKDDLKDLVAKPLEDKNAKDAKETQASKHKSKNILDTSIIDTFNKPDTQERIEQVISEETISDILKKLKNLFLVSGFSISNIELKAIDGQTLEIALDGDDAALLIGKEGHRYRALSYMLFNWINSKYGYNVRLEIAQFLKTQEEMIGQYVVNLSQKIRENGRVQSRPLDGILLKIALDKLRKDFPDKYVGVKHSGDNKYIVVNDFGKK